MTFTAQTRLSPVFVQQSPHPQNLDQTQLTTRDALRRGLGRRQQESEAEKTSARSAVYRQSTPLYYRQSRTQPQSMARLASIKLQFSKETKQNIKQIDLFPAEQLASFSLKTKLAGQEWQTEVKKGKQNGLRWPKKKALVSAKKNRRRQGNFLTRPYCGLALREVFGVLFVYFLLNFIPLGNFWCRTFLKTSFLKTYPTGYRYHV